MELFFAGVPAINILARFYDLTGIKVNILKNYYELQDKDFKKEILSYKPYVNKIMLDSGAFSANNSLSPIEAEAIRKRYPIFLKVNSDFINEFIYRVFNYDYRFDQEGFTDNYTMFVKLRSAYKFVCPVIHTFTNNGENPEIDEYSIFNSPTMAIGQIMNEKTCTRIDRTSKNNLPFLQNTIDSIKKTNSACHLFGIMNYEALKQLQNYDTCDSTSWNNYARTGTVIIFWDNYPYLGKAFYGCYNFPQHQKTNNNTKSFDTLDKSLQIRFFDDMKKELKLDKYNFYNTKATESLELANLYYSIKFAEYINNRPLQLNKTPKHKLNTTNMGKDGPNGQKSVTVDSSVKSTVSKLLETNPFEMHKHKENSQDVVVGSIIQENPFVSLNKEMIIEQEVVNKLEPETNPFEMPEHRDIPQEVISSIPEKNPFGPIKKDGDEEI